MGDAGTQIPFAETQLPVSQPLADPAETHPREIHILVTGFGPFKSFTNNPSYLIASALPQTLSPAPPAPQPPNESTKPQPARRTLSCLFNRRSSSNPQARDQAQPTPQPIRTPNDKPYIIRVHTYPDPIHVAYAPTSVLVPSLLDPATNGSIFPDFPGGIDFDYILHIGLASGRDSYTLETLVHRDDYLIPDVDDSVGTSVSDIWRREGIPSSLDVGWDGADVLRRWKAEVERREAEGLLNVEEASAPEHTSASVPDTKSGPTTNDKTEQNANDPAAKGWILRHGVLLHSSTAASQSSPEQSPSQSTATTTPVGGGSTLRKATNPTKPPRKAIVKLSRDAGRFLCEFILTCSLVHRWKQYHSQPTSANSKLGKVAFLHVPNGTDAADVARGAMVAESAIRSVIGSWEAGWRNPAVYEGEFGAGVSEVGADVGVGEGGFEHRGTGDEVPR